MGRSSLQLLNALPTKGAFVPLFTPWKSPLWTADLKRLTEGHLVVVPRSAEEQRRIDEEGKKAGFWSPPLGIGRARSQLQFGVKDLRRAYPMVRGCTQDFGDDGHPEADTLPDLRVLAQDGEDLHELFYRVALTLRKDFAFQAAQQIAVSLVSYRKRGFFTLVDIPFIVEPLPDGKPGFYIQRGYTRHVVPYEATMQTGDVNLGGWDVYSRHGEFPLEIPAAIDRERLVYIEKSILERRRRLPKILKAVINPMP